jgi:hypothetical protein
MASGAAKSGNPWARLTALCFMARRVISRITDSVNVSVRLDSSIKTLSLPALMWFKHISGFRCGLQMGVVESLFLLVLRSRSLNHLLGFQNQHLETSTTRFFSFILQYYHYVEF